MYVQFCFSFRTFCFFSECCGKDLPWKLAALQYYLVVILKHNSKMEELKNVTVLFKTSLFEHFGEALLRPLCNLNTLADYQNLDTFLVYNLLRNVSKYITPLNEAGGMNLLLMM